MARGGLGKWFGQRWVNIGAPKKKGKYQPCGRKKAKKSRNHTENILLKNLIKILKVFLMWTIPTFLSLIFSILLWFFVSKLSGIFVGIWVSSIILFGSVMISMKGEGK